MPSIVRPEFGPTLPELLAPRWRRLNRFWRAAIVVACAAIVLVAAYALVGGGSGMRTLKVATPIPITIPYDGAALQQRVAVGNELFRLSTPPSAADPATLSASPITIAPYRGSIEGTLPIVASRLTEQMRRVDPGLIVRGYLPVLVKQRPGYEILFQFKRAGRTRYGRRVIVFADQPGVREGLDILMTSARSLRIPTSEQLGRQPPLRDPYQALVQGG
ncbi:MAG: hypothetical protein F2813_02025 [Actinobacteria bacterium]|uniref:Unannotated protein n=1 Tax=freshwater metagenome TaxID=449393 RepID=A0A6J5Z902_9ZZZZ|nr:hypothetical protein [Actinomycetota bacterium]